MSRLFDLPRHIKPLRAGVYMLIAAVAVFMLSVGLGILLALIGTSHVSADPASTAPIAASMIVGVV